MVIAESRSWWVSRLVGGWRASDLKIVDVVFMVLVVIIMIIIAIISSVAVYYRNLNNQRAL